MGFKCNSKIVGYSQVLCVTLGGFFVLCWSLMWFPGVISGQKCWLPTPFESLHGPSSTIKDNPQGGSMQVSCYNHNFAITSQTLNKQPSKYLSFYPQISIGFKEIVLVVERDHSRKTTANKNIDIYRAQSATSTKHS